MKYPHMVIEFARTSYNRRISGYGLSPSAQIPLRGTSDTLKTLADMPIRGKKHDNLKIEDE